MRKTGLIVICFVMIVTGMSTTFAHQPHLVKEDVIVVERPEVSQAFYASLAGDADLYNIVSEDDFLLHVSLLVPDLPNVRKDFVAEIYRTNENHSELIHTLDGDKHKWERFFEPFAGDQYFQGPEISKVVAAGKYSIVIINGQNKGKYVLGIGKEDSFALAEMVKNYQ